MSNVPRRSRWWWLNPFAVSHHERLRRERIEIAKRQQTTWDNLYDPIKDEPLIRPLIAEAAALADAEVPNSGRGRCHTLWAAQQRILRDRFDIAWFTPSEMNPHIRYD